MRWAAGMLVGLLIESVLGLGLTLYVNVPSSPSPFQVFLSIPLLSAHIVIGLLLLVGTAGFFLASRRADVAGLPVRAGVALLFVALAIQEGFSFTFTGNELYSDGMALSFVAAVLAQVSVLSLLGADRRRSTAVEATPASPSPGEPSTRT